MNLIDAEGLTSAPVSVRTYCRSLGVTGHLVPAGRRLAVLKRLHEEPGHVVVTRDPKYWALTHPRNLVRVLPEGELPVKDRLRDLDVYALWCTGLSRPQARGTLAKKKDSLAKDMAKAFVHTWERTAPDDLQGLEEIGESPQVQERRFEYHLVDNPQTYVLWMNALMRAREKGQIGLDVEGTSEDDRTAELVGIGVSVGDQAFYAPLNGPIPKEAILAALTKLLPKVKYVAHHAKYDSKMLRRAGLPIDQAELVGDGLIAAYVLAEVDQLGRPKPKGLKPLCQRYLGVQLNTFEEMLLLSGAKDASEVPLDQIGPYCAADAYYAVGIERLLRGELEKRGGLELYEKLELPNVLLLAEMELLGLPIDKGEAERRAKRYTTNVKLRGANLHVLAQRQGWSKVRTESCKMHTRAKAKIAACSYCGGDGKLQAPAPFNPASGPMLREVFQDYFHLPAVAMTPKGLASYDEDALLLLKEQAEGLAKEFIEQLLVYRGDSKILSTYLKPFLEKAVKHVED